LPCFFVWTMTTNTPHQNPTWKHHRFDGVGAAKPTCIRSDFVTHTWFFFENGTLLPLTPKVFSSFSHLLTQIIAVHFFHFMSHPDIQPTARSLIFSGANKFGSHAHLHTVCFSTMATIIPLGSTPPDMTKLFRSTACVTWIVKNPFLQDHRKYNST
jgi:hypothetical protein